MHPLRVFPTRNSGGGIFKKATRGPVSEMSNLGEIRSVWWGREKKPKPPAEVFLLKPEINTRDNWEGITEISPLSKANELGG